MMEAFAAMLPQWAKKDKKKSKKDAATPLAGKNKGSDASDAATAAAYDVITMDKKQRMELREEEERIRRKHEELLAHMRDAGFFDCVCSIWMLAFLLIVSVSFTPLFSSFMAIYVVRKRVDDLVPKNLNVTAIDAAFVFQSTFAKPISDSGNDIAVSMYNRLQAEEWARRREALRHAQSWGSVHARRKYNLPSLTEAQEDFLARVCDGWQEQVPDAHKTGATAKWARMHAAMTTTTTTSRDFSKCIDPSQATSESSCVWANVSSASLPVPAELGASIASEEYLKRLQYKLANLSATDAIEATALEHIYGAVDNIVRKATIGSSFSGHGFVAVWGVDLNESGAVSPADAGVEILASLQRATASRGLKFYCAWKYGGLRSARTVNTLVDSSDVAFSPSSHGGGTTAAIPPPRGSAGRMLAYANFSWLARSVPWGSAPAVAACAVTCATTQFGVFSSQYKPPRTTHPQCDCRSNATERFYFGADWDSSVTVLRPAKRPPTARPNPYVRSQTSPAGKTTFFPSVLGNYSNYLWLDIAQTYDTFSLLNNVSSEDLIARSVALSKVPVAGASFSADWVAYNVSFEHAVAQLLQTDSDWLARSWPDMLGHTTMSDTLVDADLIQTNYIAKAVKAPVFSELRGRVTGCSLPRWFYGLERAPAPCGVESSFAADTLTLYRVTPVVLRRQNFLRSDLFSETPVRVANVVTGRRLPLGLLQRVLYPLARQSAFQFSIVDATTMRELVCVDGTNAKTGAVMAGSSGAQLTVWNNAWHTLAAYLPDQLVPVSWRYPLTSEALEQDSSFDWSTFRYHSDPNITQHQLQKNADAAARKGFLSQNDNKKYGGDQDADIHDEVVDNSMFLPPDAKCKKSATASVLDILSGRVKPEFPLVDSDRLPLSSLEDFTRLPRVVFSEAYLYAVPISLEDPNTKAYNPAQDLERTVCESFAVDEVAEYEFNRAPGRAATDNTTAPGMPGGTDVFCSSQRNTMTKKVVDGLRNTMRLARANVPIDPSLLKVEDATPAPTTDSAGNIATPPPQQQQPTAAPPGAARTPQEFFKTNKNRGNLYIVVSLQSRDLLELVLRSRSQVVVTSAICAFIIIIAIFVVIRGLSGPLKQLRKVLMACTDLSWVGISVVNGSTIAEVLELQFSMSYITVKMKSFARFLPPGLRQFGEAAQQQLSLNNPKHRRIFDVLKEGDSSDSDNDAFGAGSAAAAAPAGPGSDIADDFKSLGYSADGSDAPGLYGQGLSADAEDDRDYELQVMEKEIDKLDMSGRSTNYARQMHYSSLGPSGALRARRDAKRARQRAWKAPSLFHARRDHDGERRPPVITAERLGLHSTFDLLTQETPLHSIYVDVRYEGVPIDVWEEESEKVQRRVLTGDYAAMLRNTLYDEKPLVFTKFMLKYRSTDPLVQLVSRGCREVLQERPGETLLIFVDSPEGKVQIVHNEDMLFALEQHTSRGTLSPIEITVAKRKPSTKHVPWILFLTIGGTLSRFALSFERMGMDLEARVRLIGVLLIASLTMQLASNMLLYVFLLHKCAKTDLEFHLWRQVSTKETRVGFILSLFSIANFEFLGVYKNFCGNALRFTAPFTPALMAHVRHMACFGFIFEYFIPLAILWVETVLRQSYRDAAMWFTSLFGCIGLLTTLHRHGMLTMFNEIKPEGRRQQGPFSGKTQGLASLSRKEATIVKLRLAQTQALLSTLDMHHVDTLCEAVYSVVSPLVRSAGGLMVRVDGLTFTVIFNAANSTPHHAAAAFSFVWLVNAALRRHMAPLLAEHAHRYWNLDKELTATGSIGGELNTKKVLDEFCARWHRVVAGIVTAEMAVGYSGSSLLRTYQHADWTHQFADGLMNLAEHYGAEVLTNEQCAMSLQQASEPTGVLARRPALVRHIDVVGVATVEPSILRLTHDRQASNFRAGLRREKVFEALSTTRGLPIHGTWNVPAALKSIYTCGFSYPYDDACASLLLAHAKLGGGFECADRTAAKPMLEQQAVRAALAKFALASEQVFVCQEPRLLQQYCRDYPLDEVAAKVHRWARFFGSPNQSEGVVFPRLLSGMGVQPHPCELLHGVGSQSGTAGSTAASNRKNVKFRLGNTMRDNNNNNNNNNTSDNDSDNSPQQRRAAAGNDAGAEALDADARHQRAVQESRRFFDIAPLTRPPRSERRMAGAVRSGASFGAGGAGSSPAAAGGSAGGQASVFDAILAQNLQHKQFSVTFAPRLDDEPINDL